MPQVLPIPATSFRPDVLRYDEHIFVLRRRLDARAWQEDETWFIGCEELDVTVWGDSREQAEEAFAFAFCAHYLNYYLADDGRLAPDALAYKKQRVHRLIA
jgi:hypothetical protein